VRLRAILHDEQVVPRGDFHQVRHVHRLAVEMHRHDGLDLWVAELGEHRLERGDIQQHRAGLDVGKHRLRPGGHDGRDGRRDGVGDGDDLVARADAGGVQRQLDGIGAVGHADGARAAEPRAEFPFKGLEFRPEDVVPAAQHALDGGIDLRLGGEIGGLRIGGEYFAHR
jgi:hypothetical protein